MTANGSEKLATQLEQLLKDLQLPSISASSSSTSTLNTAELELVESALSQPDVSTTSSSNGRTRSLAYLVLAQAVQARPGSDIPVASSTIASHIKSQLEETDPEPLIRALSLLSAVFQVDAIYGSQILQYNGIVQGLGDVIELEELSLGRTSPSASKDSISLVQAKLGLSLAETISSSLNAPASRPIIRSIAFDWLTHKVRSRAKETESDVIRSITSRTTVVCSVALTKLIKAEAADPLVNASATAGETETDPAEVAKTKSEIAGQLRDLTDLFSKTVISTETGSEDGLDFDTLSSAIEGLAYTSSQPAVKARLCGDETLLRSLFAISARLAKGPAAKASGERKTGLSASYGLNADLDRPGERPKEINSLGYGITTVLLNFFSRRPALTAEQQQVEKLKLLASAGKAKQKMGDSLRGDDEDDQINSNEAVEARVTTALKAGLTTCLVNLAKADSMRVKILVGRLLLEVVTDAGTRTSVVKDGGFKALMSIVASATRDSQKSLKPDEIPPTVGKETAPDALPALQALAKMLITLPPGVLFGVNPATACLDTIRPLCILLSHEHSVLLQKFEAMMALTNLASIGPEVATRICRLRDGEILKAAEHLMLEDNDLVRRAAVELICNLLAADEAFGRYSGDELDDKEKSSEASVFSRQHMLLAMTNVYDLNTRLAASGALATLTQSSNACRILLGTQERQRKVFSMVCDMLASPVVRSDEETGDETVEEISTLEPDSGLVFRAVVVLVNLLGYATIQESASKDQLMQTVDQSELPRRLLELLASWTSPSSTTHPGKEVAEVTIECLRILKSAGIKLTM